MNNWQELIQKVLPTTSGDCFWRNFLVQSLQDESPVGVHLAIFNEPYLSYILQGKKTVESRFGIKRCAPYGKVAPSDLIFLKKSSGPIVGLCTITDVWFYSLSPKSWNNIRTEFADALCAQDPEFWVKRESASYATLMQVGKVIEIEPMSYQKKDRRGWVVLRTTTSPIGGLYL